MSETEALRARRSLPFERLCQAADEIRRIDRRLMWIEAGKPGADSGLPGSTLTLP